MDYKIIRLNSANADITSANKKDYTFFLRKPMILKDEYVMQLKELLVDSTYTTSAPIGAIHLTAFIHFIHKMQQIH